jgi:hypothetical protein
VADPVPGSAPESDNGRVPGNYLLVADPVPDSGRRAAGPRLRSDLPKGEAQQT